MSRPLIERPGASRSRMELFASLLVLILLFATACTRSELDRPDDHRSVTGAGTVTLGRTTASLVGADDDVTISDVELTSEQVADLSSWGDLSVIVGTPVAITTEGDASAGVRISRTYSEPLPEEAAATLAYFDTSLGGWVAVPSELSDDRRTISAVVDHLSWWNDFISGTAAAVDKIVKTISKAVTTAAEWTFYQVGKTFDTRVDSPTCTSPEPEWVDSVSYIETHMNNPLLFCAGTDLASPELLEIKVRVNRGFGFNAVIAGQPAWTYNSTMNETAQADILSVLGELDQAFAQSFNELTAAAGFIGPGQEFSLGVSEDVVRANVGGPILKLTRQDPLPFVLTLLGQFMGQYMGLKADGYAAAVMATASCANDIRAAQSTGAIWKAVTSCVGALDDQFAKSLALYLDKRGVANAGTLAGQLLGRASIMLAVMGPTFNAINYGVDQAIVDGARTVYVFPDRASAPELGETASGQATNIVLDTPVDLMGNMQPGYEVDDPNHHISTCSYTSESAVSPNIYYCGGGALGADVCWMGPSPMTVICAHQPGKPYTMLIVADSLPEVQPIAQPTPWWIVLENGLECRLRNGGAWGGRADGLVGAYWCSGDDRVVLVEQDGYVPPVDQSKAHWTVRLGELGYIDEHFPAPEVIGVKTAYFASYA